MDKYAERKCLEGRLPDKTHNYGLIYHKDICKFVNTTLFAPGAGAVQVIK